MEGIAAPRERKGINPKGNPKEAKQTCLYSLARVAEVSWFDFISSPLPQSISERVDKVPWFDPNL